MKTLFLFDPGAYANLVPKPAFSNRSEFQGNADRRNRGSRKFGLACNAEKLSADSESRAEALEDSKRDIAWVREKADFFHCMTGRKEGRSWKDRPDE